MADDIFSRIYGGRSPDELRAMSEQLGDMEFQTELAPYFDYAAPLDPSIARYHGWKGPGRLSTGGFNVPPDISDETLAREQRRYRYKNDEGGKTKIPLERGTVNAINAEAQPRTWAHEYRHQMGEDGNNEGSNRKFDAMSAQTDSDWGRTLQLHQDWEYRKGNTMPLGEAQEHLLEILHPRTGSPRHFYGRDYDRGARNPAAPESMMLGEKGEYIEDRTKRSVWFRKMKELESLKEWESGLSERNSARRAGEPETLLDRIAGLFSQ